jgi:uncharacterized protein with PQ loop repeat
LLFHIGQSLLLGPEYQEKLVKPCIHINMAVELAVIVCPIVFGLCFLSHTIYFLYKIIKGRQSDYSKSTPVTSIHMTEGEASVCMGWAWTSCIDKTTHTISLKTFIIWYIVCLCFDVLATLLFYFLLHNYVRHRV